MRAGGPRSQGRSAQRCHNFQTQRHHELHPPPLPHLDANWIYVDGVTARTLLVRAIGPGLTTNFGLQGTMPDPRLTLFSGAEVVAENDNWGGDAQLSAIGQSVGAFAISSPTT